MPYLHLLKENFMQLKQFLKVNLKRKNRQKILTVSYAVAVVFAFILSLSNNQVEASVSKGERLDYLMIENNVVNNLSDPETIYPEDSVDNIKSLFSMVSSLVSQKDVDKEITIQKGDTLISILNDLGLDREQANDIFYALKKYYDPRDLRAGQELLANVSVNTHSQKIVKFNSLTIEPAAGERIVASLDENGQIQVFETKDELVEEVNSASGTIDGLISTAMRNKGVPNRVVNNFVAIFNYTVDFRRDIRKGDKFEIIYENYIDKNGELVKSGNILYAALILRNDKIAMYRFKDKRGNVDYYNEKGRALKKTLDKKPLAFRNARISSPFGKRYHPILKQTRIHWGVDYAAPRGTKIFAGGDGVVQVAKYNGSYGNYIKIRHNSEFSTAYGHMQRFAKGIRPGVRVKQGQVIGYVGSTGRSTGPHLHYEVVQNGRRVNPRTIRASTGENLAGTDLKNFKKLVADLQTSYKSMFAKNKEPKMAKK